MSKFTFAVDNQSEAYFSKIAKKMMLFFDISEEEAIGRINKAFAGQVIVNNEDDFLYHETTNYWAKSIYYEPGVYWWLGEEGLQPRPYP